MIQKIKDNFIIGGIAFNFVQNAYFKQFVNNLNLEFEIPAKTKLKELFETHYIATRQRLMDRLNSLDYLSATTDAWTAIYQKKSYIGLTCHCLDTKMKPISIKLGIHELSSSHSAEQLESFLKNKLNEFLIWDKVYFFAVDNASIMRKCCKLMKKDFTGCFNHLLHLIVNRFLNIKTLKKTMAGQESEQKDDFDSSDSSDSDEDDENDDDKLNELFEQDDEISQLFPDDYYDSKEYTEQELNCLEAITLIIKKIKIIVTGFNKASFLRDQLIAKQEESDDPLTFYKILIQDVKTRWNSTYLLLDRYILLFKYVCQTINDLVKNSKKKKKYLKYQRSLLNETELELAIIVKTMLKPFFFVTKLLSTEKSTTLDIVLPSCLYVRYKITFFEYDSEYTEKVKTLMLNSFNFYIEKYEIMTNPLLICAAFLNPEHRSFKHSTNEEKDYFIDVSKNFLINTWKKLRKDDNNNVEEQETPLTPSSAKSNASFFNLINECQITSTDINIVENEILLYIKDTYIDEFSKYWVARQSIYPSLFKITRIILGCPATSVASERLFSNSSDQMWAKRNRISSKTFEKLMLIYSDLNIKQ